MESILSLCEAEWPGDRSQYLNTQSFLALNRPEHTHGNKRGVALERMDKSDGQTKTESLGERGARQAN